MFSNSNFLFNQINSAGGECIHRPKKNSTIMEQLTLTLFYFDKPTEPLKISLIILFQGFFKGKQIHILFSEYTQKNSNI